MNTKYMTIIGAIGGVIVSAFGGWDYYMQLLVISMCVDYISGVLVAAVWHRSSKGNYHSHGPYRPLYGPHDRQPVHPKFFSDWLLCK